MIECEICGNYFHADEIEKCPECDLELCPSCYEEHVSECIAGNLDFGDWEKESTIPHICPECQKNLVLDTDPDGSARVYCPNCDYVEELNEEQLAELNQCEDDYEDDYEEEEYEEDDYKEEEYEEDDDDE